MTITQGLTSTLRAGASLDFWLRVAGWSVFGVGAALLLAGQAESDFQLFKWGAVTGCIGMLLTYGANMIRSYRAARTTGRRMRKGADANGADEKPGGKSA